ncbi:uncharacterized protein LOC122560512 isoform X4 [Chiloscyllium plagiosum]|nr:uncharacterized protein LOC122560512 isoform X4 [Chiloscyllium plagiosum]XP_043567119.1 uncharacterized protein LOC122560512 isoform X4 [Chiloscyllium plagiosum]XP_043567120.1 uncharacterized protein LOC122560512 isoform X4 [Chiloscyllium plagiosum]
MRLPRSDEQGGPQSFAPLKRTQQLHSKYAKCKNEVGEPLVPPSSPADIVWWETADSHGVIEMYNMETDPSVQLVHAVGYSTSSVTSAIIITYARKQSLLAQTPPLEFAVHSIQLGDWVLVKSWTETKLQPDLERPYQALLTTETAIRMAGKGWTHYTRVKGPVESPVEEEVWTAESTEAPLKLKLKRL